MTNTGSAPASSALDANIYAPAAAMVDAFAPALAARVALAETDVAYGDWVDGSRGRDYVALLRTARVWSPEPGRLVVSVANTADGRIWGYEAAALVEAAFLAVYPGGSAGPEAPRVRRSEPEVSQPTPVMACIEW